MINELISKPSGWERVSFGDIAKNITDRIESPKESGLEDYIGLDHLDTDEIRIKRFGSTNDVQATKFLCKKGDIIFGKRNAYLRKVAVTDRNAVVSAHSMVLRPNVDRIEPKFLPFFMQSTQFWKAAQAISEGSMSPTIKWKTLSTQKFWLPSRSEQKKIALILSSIELNVEKLERLIEVTKKLRKGLFEELTTKGIGHEKFQDSGIPESWNWVKLGEITVIRYGLGQPPESEENGIPMIRATNIERGVILEHSLVKVKASAVPKSKDVFLKEGDIIVVRSGAYTGDIGYISKKWEGAVAGYDLVLTPSGKINSLYLVNYLLGPKVQSLFSELRTRSAQPHLNSKQVATIRIALPPLSEQEKIVTLLNTFSKFLEECNSSLINLSELRRKLIDSFLCGQIMTQIEVLR